MDGAESDGSEDYYSASELTQPIRGCRATVSPGENPPAERRARGIVKDVNDQTAKKKRRRERHNSKTTEQSPVVHHALNGMNTLYVFWANEKLCDVIVVADGEEFLAHGVVLATHSDFFLRLLLRRQTGPVASPYRVTLGSLVSVSGLRKILHYMYTAEMELTWASVCETLRVACALKVTRVVQLAQEFLQSYDIENCLTALSAATQAHLTLLSVRIHKFVTENFPAVSRTREFRQCPADAIASLLADDSLNVSSELDVLTAAKNWIHANGEEGIKSAPVIMRQVRLHQIPSDELAKRIEMDNDLMQIPEVRSRVMPVHIKRHSPPAASANALVGSTAEDITTEAQEDAPALSVTDEDVKKTKVINQSTSSSVPSSSPKPSQYMGERHAAESDEHPEAALVGPALKQRNDAETRLKEAQIIEQSFPSQKSTLTSWDSFRPISDTNVTKPTLKQQSSIETTWKKLKPLEGEPDEVRKAIIVQSSPTVGDSSPKPQRDTSSPIPLPVPDTKDGKSLTLSNMKTPTSPRKFATHFHAPRLTSDYRITASNPKALTSGPVAWPVTKLMERRQKPDVILAVGGVAKSGESEIAGRMVEAFLLDKNEWHELERMPAPRNHHVVHFLNGFVYVVGGSDPHSEGEEFLKPVNSVLKYDIRIGKWSEAHPMNSARIFHEVTALFGQLYVVGGQDQEGRTLATVECYSPNSDRWHYVAPLPSARYGVAVTVYRGRIWVAGGFPEEQLAEASAVPRDVICYNPFRNEWSSMTPLRVPRCHASLLEIANKLYMIGGFVGDSSASDEKSQSVSTIETYNESSEDWDFVADLWQGRHDANTVTLGDKAYIIGGMEDENEDPLPNVECFDPVAMSWVRGLKSLSTARFGHACCVVPSDVLIKWPKA